MHLAFPVWSWFGGVYPARHRVQHALLARVARLPCSQAGLVDFPRRVHEGSLGVHQWGGRGLRTRDDRGVNHGVRGEPQEPRNPPASRHRGRYPRYNTPKESQGPKSTDVGPKARSARRCSSDWSIGTICIEAQNWEFMSNFKTNNFFVTTNYFFVTTP